MANRTTLVVFTIVCAFILLSPSYPITAQAADFDASGPYIEKVYLDVITGDDAQVQALQNNVIDLIGDTVDPSFLPQLQSSSDITVTEQVRNGYGYFTINCDKYPLNLTAFRRAAAFALDKQAICTDTWDGLAEPTDSPIGITNPMSVEGDLSYNYYEGYIAEAGSILTNAGFLDVDSDGIREAPDGSEFNVLIECAQSSNIAIECGQKLADALTALSIDATIASVDFYEYLSKLNFHEDYDIAFLGRSLGDFDTDWLAYEYWSDYADAYYWNFPNFRNVTYDSWRDQLLYSSDYNDVLVATQEMQKILMFECPIIPIYSNILLHANRNDRFTGFVNDVQDGTKSYWTKLKTQLRASEGGPYGGTLRVSNPLGLDTWNILTTGSQYTMNALELMYDSLLMRSPDGNYMEWLAESYIIETNADNPDVPAGHTRITFEITNNATWSDGVPLTAHDVAFTFNYMLENEISITNTDFFGLYAPTDYTFIAEFSSESYWHLSDIAETKILPKHQWYDKVYYEFNPNYYDLVTSGPFYPTGHVGGEYVELTHNPWFFRNPSVARQAPQSPPPVPVAPPPAPEPTSDPFTEELDAMQEAWDSPDYEPNIDSRLLNWMQGEELDSIVVTTDENPNVILYCPSDTPIETLDSSLDISWTVDLGVFRIVHGSVISRDAFSSLIQDPAVKSILADEYKSRPMNDLERDFAKDTQIPPYSLDMAEFRELVGSTDTLSSQYTGNGVIVGHLDTGCDFGQPDLQGAYSNDSYDASGFGLTLTNSIGNSSYVDPSTWSGLLTYENGGNYYLNTTGWDPVVNNGGSARYLMGLLSPYGNGYPAGSDVGFIGLYEHYWNIDNASEFVYNEIWKDWQIPDPSTIAGDYHFGWIYQHRNSPYLKMFAPVMVFQTEIDGPYQMIVDWDGMDGWTTLWNGAIYYESYDLTITADRNEIANLFDWSFVDDFNSEVYNLTNGIVATDFNGDSIDDVSLGALAWTIDPGFFGDEKVFKGFRSDGNATALYYDFGTHGTATAAHVASRGTHTYYDYANQSYFTMPGIANESTLISVASLTSGTEIGAYLWACGFDYDEGTSAFTYTGNHQADFTTNSWGWVVEPSFEFNYYSLTWNILSNPSILNITYDGVLHVFSAGNEGSGYMTISPPGCAASVLTVGATTSHQYIEYLYGPQTINNTIAGFSSKGPAFSGYPKPDVMAPGMAGFSATPMYSQYYQDRFEDSPYGFAGLNNYTLFSGTSQSAPVAAGVVALVIEALDTAGISWTPDGVKTIIQSTADPLGYDPATEGFGLINAEAAIDYIENGGVRSYCTDSFNNLADILDNPYRHYEGYYPNMLDSEDIYSMTNYPRDFGESNLYFGEVYSGDTITLNQDIYTSVNNDLLTNLTGWSAQASHWRASEIRTFTNTTGAYLDPVTNETMYNFFDLYDLFGSLDYNNLMNTHSYMTIAVSFDGTEVWGWEPMLYVYDWVDSNFDNMPNMYNSSTGEGDELDRIGVDSNPSPTTMVPFAVSSGNLLNALNGDLTVIVRDPLHDSDPQLAGHEFTCTVIFWEQVNSNEISATPDGISCTYNWTLNVPSNAEAGIHTGYAYMSNGTYTLRIPYSYTVVQTLSDVEGEATTVVENYGGELTPYDWAVYGCIGESVDDWDFRSFMVYCPNDTANYLGVRVEFDNVVSTMAFSIWDSNLSYRVDSPEPTGTSTALIYEINGNPQQVFRILLHPTELLGPSQLPANYTLEVIWYSTLPDLTPTLGYTTNTQPTLTTLNDGDTATGDHVVLNVTYPTPTLSNMSEYEINWCEISIESGIYETRSGNLVIPEAAYNPFSGAIDDSQFAWEYVSGIEEGDTVKITCDFTNSDCDIMVWWADTDNTTWTYSNNLVGTDMATSGHPETGEFVADRGGTLAIGIFDYDLQTGTYDLTVDTLVGISTSDHSKTLSIDTNSLQNGTYQVTMRGTTNVGPEITTIYQITLNNWFDPSVSLTSPVGGETWTGTHNIVWSASSQMVDADLSTDVYISNDGGITYQLYASGISTSSFSWDTSEWLYLSTYVVKVVTVDNQPSEYILEDMDISNNLTAGNPSLSDSTDPKVFGDASLYFELGSLDAEVTWLVSDLHPGSIEIYVNESLNETVTWSTYSVEVSVNCSEYQIGTTNFTILVTDGGSNSVSYTTMLTIDDTNYAPTFVSTPSDLTYGVGSTGHTLTWIPSDANPYWYQIYNTTNLLVNTTWDGSSIDYIVDGLALGNYEYQLIVFDTKGLNATDNVTVNVVTDTGPPIIDSPPDVTYAEGTTGNNITWTTSDDSPGTWIVYQNGTEYDSGTLTGSPEDIVIDIDGLDYGIYNFTVIVFDSISSLNNVTDTVYVFVIDTTEPVVSTESDISYVEGSTGNAIQWTLTDLNPNSYYVFRNGTQIASAGWSVSPSTISIGIDGLSYGVYNYTIVIYDVDWNSDTDSVLVTVYDGTDPHINPVDDMEFAMGTSGLAITWGISDANPHSWIVYRNGSEFHSGSWTTSPDQVIVSLDGLLNAVYNYTLVIQDLDGNTANDTVFVTVVDATPPEISSPDDITYSEGTTGNEITWTISDNNPQTYTVYRNGSVQVSGTWSLSPDTITIGVDDLTIGVYNYTLKAVDAFGSSSIDTVLVTVIDTTDPVVNSPEDLLFAEGDIGYSIDWEISDANPLRYTVYQNGTVIMENNWIISPEDVSVNLDDAGAGYHNYTIVIVDMGGNVVTDTVIVQIRDIVDPILDSPDDIIYYFGWTGNNITWTAEDLHPGSYVLYLDGDVVNEGDWTENPEELIFNIDGLEVGTYNYTLVIFDESGNSASDTVMVTVEPDTTGGPDLGDIMLIFQFIIVVGSGVVIIVFIILIIRARRGK